MVQGPRAPVRPDLPALAGVAPSIWGDVVHGWFAKWQFRGAPHVEAAAEYLARRWSVSEPLLARWLVDVGQAVRALPGFSDLLMHTLHFEWPLAGVDGDLLWAGRTDLVVELPNRKLILIDFKAGVSAPTSLSDIPHLDVYAPQLEAYRRVLEAAGYGVEEIGLVYVGGVGWVRAERGG